MSHKFNWENFILFSEFLFSNEIYQIFDKQTIHRVICSRCYYGAFKPFEDYLKNKDIKLPSHDKYGKPLGSHDKVIKYIEENIDKNIGRYLKRLKINRVRADYLAKDFLSSKDVENSMRLSKIAHKFFTKLI